MKFEEYKVLILPAAKNDIKESAVWYNTRQSNLGKRYTDEVKNILKVIRTNPFLFAVRYDTTRTAILDTFPFMVHYTILENEKTILIQAVFHTSLNPVKWFDRE